MDQKNDKIDNILNLTRALSNLRKIMTHFINCYENIEIQIARMTITEQKNDRDCENIYEDQKCKSIIKTSMQRTFLKSYLIFEQLSDDVLLFTGIYEYSDTIFPAIDLFYQITFNIRNHQITMFSSLLRNYIPFRIKQKTQILMLSKFFIKTNSFLRLGSFRLAPKSGEIALCMNSMMAQHQFDLLLIEPIKITEYINEQIVKSKYYWRIYLPKILHLVNEIDSTSQRQSSLTKMKIKQMHSGVSYYDNFLAKISPYLHIQFPFMYSQNTFTGSKSITPEQISKITDTINSIKHTKKNLNQPTIKNIAKLSNFGETSQQAKMNDDEKRQMIGMLLPPVMRYPFGQPSQVLSEIEMMNLLNNEWQVIDQGGFARISKAIVEFRFREQQGNNRNGQIDYTLNQVTFTRPLIRKQEFTGTNQKIPHQKTILSKINPHSSPFVAKFYYSTQQQNSSYLFAQYCPQRSLLSFKSRTRQFLSLSSKLLLLRYIAQSLKFLKDNHVLHLDLKPSNILVSPGLVKIIDFGQSYHPQVCDRNFRPGTTLPYAPPQSFIFQIYQNSRYLDRMDIFSYGILMFQLLYDSFPIDYSRQKSDLLCKRYIHKNYQVIVAPQKFNRIGYKSINYWLVLLTLKCLDPDEKKRPCIQWIIIYLNYCINMEQYLYF